MSALQEVFAASGVGLDRAGTLVKQDVRDTIRGEHFPEYADLLERLEDLMPLAAACASKGGHLHYPFDADNRRRRKAHVEWVAKATGRRIREVKALINHPIRRFAR